MEDQMRAIREELKELKHAFVAHEKSCVKNREASIAQMTRVESDIAHLKVQAAENREGIRALNAKFNKVLYSVIALIAIVGGDEAISLIKLVT